MSFHFDFMQLLTDFLLGTPASGLQLLVELQNMFRKTGICVISRGPTQDLHCEESDSELQS